MKYDAIIIGAGPAGSSAAYFLGRENYNVLLVDKKDFPRDKLCSGGISPRTLKVLEVMSIRDNVEKIGYKIDGARIYSPNRACFEGNIPKTSQYDEYGFIVNRSEFDYILKENVLSQKVDFIKGDVKGLVLDSGFVKGVKLERRVIKSKITIVTNGINSIRYDISPQFKKEDRMICVQGLYENVSGLDSKVEMYYERSLLPGYFWIFPRTKDKATVGLGVAGGRLGNKNIHRLYEEIISKNRTVESKLKLSRCIKKPKLWSIPFRNQTTKAFGNGVLFVGDAVGLANPLTGEGIAYALESGRLACDVSSEAIEKGDFSESVLQRYGELCDKEFGKDIKASKEFKRMFESPQNMNDIVSLASSNKEMNSLIQGVVVNVIPKDWALSKVKDFMGQDGKK